ncbi:MAG: HNH endonuclease [Acidobacteria bacterium]|nr:HNH endonuclease [Acidobacteriota bacterium]
MHSRLLTVVGISVPAKTGAGVPGTQMISILTKLFVFSRDHFTCIFCGKGVPEVELVLDHWLPVTRGGGDDLRNLMTTCTRCASQKGDRTRSEFSRSLREKNLSATASSA